VYPGLKEGGEGLLFPLWLFSPWEIESEQVTFEISILTFTKKTNRHFSIIYRTGGDDVEGEIALNYSSL
jgi:hypothetical protein